MGCGHSGRGSGSPWTPRRRRCNPCADVAAQNSSLPFVGGRRDRCLTSPSRTSSPQPPLAIYRYSGSPPPPSNPAKYSCQRTRSLRRRYVFGVSRILMWLRPKYKLFLIISVYRKIPCILSMRLTLIDMYFTATLERDISRWALVMREIVITYVSSHVMYVQ